MMILFRFDELMNMFLQSRENPPHPRVSQLRDSGLWTSNLAICPNILPVNGVLNIYVWQPSPLNIFARPSCEHPCFTANHQSVMQIDIATIDQYKCKETQQRTRQCAEETSKLVDGKKFDT